MEGMAAWRGLRGEGALFCLYAVKEVWVKAHEQNSKERSQLGMERRGDAEGLLRWERGPDHDWLGTMAAAFTSRCVPVGVAGRAVQHAAWREKEDIKARMRAGEVAD